MKTKSITKKILVIAAVSLVLALVLCSCGSKTAVTKDTFISKADSAGMLTEDNTDGYSDYDYVESCTTAGKTDGSDVLWTADFLVANSEDKAKGMYESNKASFETVSGSCTSVSMGNYDTYERNGDGKYMYLCRVDKTLLYIDIDEKYKDEAKKLIEAQYH